MPKHWRVGVILQNEILSIIMNNSYSVLLKW